MTYRLFYKYMSVGVIILFIGISIQPVVAEEDKEQKINMEIEENEKLNGRGFIVCYTRISSPRFRFYFPASLSIVSCEDLDTGMIRFGVTRFLGIYIFKFLPTGHNYKLNVYPPDAWGGEKTINDLGNVDIAIFSIN